MINVPGMEAFGITSPSHEGSSSREEAMNAAKQFEAFFTGYVFQTAYEAIPKDEGFLGGGMADEIYGSLFIQQAASGSILSGQGLGMAHQMVRPSNDESFEIPEAPVSSDFGPRVHPLLGDVRFHKGVDLALPPGSPIKAAADGTVIFSGDKGGYGKTVMLKHEDGYSTLYAHNQENKVQVGDKVSKGQVIGFTGNSGRTTGPHMHFELHRNGEAVDPKKYVGFSEKV